MKLIKLVPLMALTVVTLLAFAFPPGSTSPEGCEKGYNVLKDSCDMDAAAGATPSEVRTCILSASNFYKNCMLAANIE